MKIRIYPQEDLTQEARDRINEGLEAEHEENLLAEADFIDAPKELTGNTPALLDWYCNQEHGISRDDYIAEKIAHDWNVCMGVTISI